MKQTKNKKLKVAFTKSFIEDLDRITSFRYRITDFFPNLYREIKYKFQRVRRGYSDRDIWSIDYFLSEVLPPMLRRLRKICSGHPANLGKDGYEKWQDILEEMAQGFEAAGKIIDADYFEFDENGELLDSWIKQERELYEKFDRAMDLLKKHFFDLWD